MFALYDYGCVLSARCTVDAVAVSVPICFGVAVLPLSTSSYSSYSSFIESGECRYAILDTDGSDRNRVTVTVDIAKWFGIADPVEEPALRSTAAANPSQSLYFHVFTQDVNKTSTANSEIAVTIDFDVVFYGPKQLGTS